MSKIKSKFEPPKFITDQGIDLVKYNKWLTAKALAHVRRDRDRFGIHFLQSDFKRMIHEAVMRSNGFDEYTGVMLRWDQLSAYNNAASKAKKAKYLKELSGLPTVDHEFSDHTDQFTFKICGWLTNSCKSRCTHAEFIALCQSVLNHHLKLNVGRSE